MWVLAEAVGRYLVHKEVSVVFALSGFACD